MNCFKVLFVEDNQQNMMIRPSAPELYSVKEAGGSSVSSGFSEKNTTCSPWSIFNNCNEIRRAIPDFQS
jgi:hypothetical protein